MSAGYASRLSEYKWKGICGLPERQDTQRTLNSKISKLVHLIRESKHTVILTGAGISTSAGIPDFRGPNGVWTLEEKNKNKREKKKKKQLVGDAIDDSEIIKETATTTSNDSSSKANIDENINTGKNGNSVSTDAMTNNTNGKNRKRKRRLKVPNPPKHKVLDDFSYAKPTKTHVVITTLIHAEFFQYCITQNVDGLHKRAGLSRDHLSVLHGCVFTEVCEVCNTEHFRDYDVGGMSLQKTGRKCEAPDCGGDLRDTLLDWEDALPEEDFEYSTKQCEMADLVICLGTSLRIQPAGDLPTLAKKFVIVNLQETPYDQDAAIVIKAPVDDVMYEVMDRLGFETHNAINKQNPAVERLWRRKKEKCEEQLEKESRDKTGAKEKLQKVYDCLSEGETDEIN